MIALTTAKMIVKRPMGLRYTRIQSSHNVTRNHAAPRASNKLSQASKSIPIIFLEPSAYAAGPNENSIRVHSRWCR
jgi:hypothetical protein